MLRKFVMILLLVFVVALTALAQDMPPLPGEVVLGDLGAPRGLAFDSAGNLYVADAGTGGAQEVMMMGPEGEAAAHVGLSGRIISVAPDGTASDYITGFPSYAAEMETLGVYRAIPNGDSVWVVFSGGGPAFTGAYWGDSVVEIDADELYTKRIINLNNFEFENNPDGVMNEDGSPYHDSNVADIAWGPDGTLYIVNAGQNSLLSWTEADGLQLVHGWGNEVPDSIEVADNGDIYIGFLGAGLAPGAGKIAHWSGGELVETFDGLNAVSDILLDGDTLYAVQLVIFGDEGPGPGSVITVSADGVTSVAEGLPAPFGLAKGPDGALYVSFGTIPLGPGMTGGVLKLDMSM